MSLIDGAFTALQPLSPSHTPLVDVKSGVEWRERGKKKNEVSSADPDRVYGAVDTPELPELPADFTLWDEGRGSHV